MILSFGDPIALLLLVISPIIILFYLSYKRKKKFAAMRFSTLGFLKEVSGKKLNLRQDIPFILIMTAIALIIIGLADPRIPLKTEKEGVNVVLAIDDSGSMAANDYTPTRLEAAKDSAEILINSLKPKDNVGIVVFESG